MRITDLINILAVLLIMLSMIVFLLWYWSRHKFFIDISVKEGGVFKSKGGRYRQSKKGHLHAMSDLLSLHPLDIDIKDYKEHIIVSEGLPFLGAKYSLNIKKIILSTPEIKKVKKSKKLIRKENKAAMEIMRMKKKLGEEYTPPKLDNYQDWYIYDKYIPWKPPIDFDRDNVIPEFSYRFYKETKIKIFNDTKVVTNAKIFTDVAVPIGLIILALALIIFLPKILEAIRDPALGYVKSEISSWQQMLQSVKGGGLKMGLFSKREQDMEDESDEEVIKRIIAEARGKKYICVNSDRFDWKMSIILNEFYKRGFKVCAAFGVSYGNDYIIFERVD